MSRPFAFLDIEATGRHPGIHEILEIGVVLADGESLASIDEFEFKVKPAHLERAEPEALAINHWSEEGWRDAWSCDEALPRFCERIRGATPAGWNVSFDRAFLEPAMNSIGIMLDTFELDYTWRDVKMDFIRWAQLAGLAERFAPRFGLAGAMRHFGISTENHHSALPDARATWQIFRALEEEFQKFSSACKK